MAYRVLRRARRHSMPRNRLGAPSPELAIGCRAPTRRGPGAKHQIGNSTDEDHDRSARHDSRPRANHSAWRAGCAERALLDDNVATFPSRVAIEFGEGGAFGSTLHVLRLSNGALHTVSESGTVTQIGSSLGTQLIDLAFGPDQRPVPALRLRVSALKTDLNRATAWRKVAGLDGSRSHRNSRWRPNAIAPRVLV